MTLPIPNLDDRRFQDLVDEAKRMLAQHCPEWTDHNVSDPGVTLIEAFATMVDQLIYRLNRVPERHYIRFMELLGIRLCPPVAARTEVTFWLTAPQREPHTLPVGTQVATAPDERGEPVVFATTDELEFVACEFGYLATEHDGVLTDRTAELLAEEPVNCFAVTPQPGDALYIGLTAALPRGVVTLRLSCAIEGIGVDPLAPPLGWQAHAGGERVDCVVEAGESGGFNRAGDVTLHLPAGHTVSVLAGQRGGWLRCVLREPRTGQPFYRDAPRLHAVRAWTIGASTDAAHAEPVEAEEIGRSDGSAGQSFGVRRRPVVAIGPGAELEVGGPQGWQSWLRVADFTRSGAQDRHFRLDAGEGAVVSGPALRLADGTVEQRGAVPPKGAALRLRYHTGGGRRGNVRAGTLSVLRTSVPYIARVTNRQPAVGGVDGEDMASAKLRAPLMLRTGFRAVTEQDYEFLATQAERSLARVRCVGEVDNVVRVLVVPQVDGELRLRFEDLRPSATQLSTVVEYLDERRTLGARVVVEPPFYRGVTVVARMSAERGASVRLVRLDALAALHRYLHPLLGGPAGTGWPFGRSVLGGDIIGLLQRLDGVDTVDSLRLFAADPVRGTRRDTPSDRIDVGPTELVFSFEHQVLID